MLLKKAFFLFAGLSLLGYPGMAAALYSDENYEETPAWIEKPRLFISKSVKAMTGAIDNFLSQDDYRIINESYLKLRLAHVFEEGGYSYPKNDLKLKVDLPKTENRWALIFETDPDEFETLEEQNQDRDSDAANLKGTDGSIGALRLILDDWRYWKADVDVGAKAPLPLNSFVRFNFRRSYLLGSAWRGRLKHSVYFFHEEGFGERSRFYLHRRLNDSWTFTNLVDMQWQHKGQELEFGEILSFQNRATDRDIFTYRAGIYYEEHPGSHVRSYFVDMRYRRRLHSNWLYGEIIPDVTWSKKYDFESLASIAFRLEVYFRN